jgi:hypothetical protein
MLRYAQSRRKTSEVIFAPAVTDGERNKYSLRVMTERQLPRVAAYAHEVLFDEQFLK